MASEGEHAHFRAAAADLAGDLGASPVRQGDIQHGHIGPYRFGEHQGFATGPGLGDHLHVALVLTSMTRPSRSIA
jgi:hypothetical protein